ncbi:hypothetical protein ACLB2K_067842 [Fragaria x ananassa]
MPPKPFANDPNLSITAATSWSTNLARRFATNPPQGTPIYFLDTGAALLGPTPSKPLSDADLNHYNSSVRRPILAQRREPGNFSTWQARSHVNVRVGEWPSATAEDRAWYEERLQTDQTIWEATGIHEAIALSFSLPPHTDRAPIAAMACLWNSATNTFDFPFGQMGITLLDILAITGLPIHAKPKGREGTKGKKMVCAGRATSRMRKENGARPDFLTRRMRAPVSPDEEIFPSLLF